jgi:hypothetical protein
MKTLISYINEAIDLYSNSELNKAIKKFLKDNNSNFEKFRKELFKDKYATTNPQFILNKNIIQLTISGEYSDNYFDRKPNTYIIRVGGQYNEINPGHYERVDKKILEVKANGGLTQDALIKAIETFLLQEFKLKK